MLKQMRILWSGNCHNKNKGRIKSTLIYLFVKIFAVVEELIGTATPEKNGLVDRSLCPSRVRAIDSKYLLLHKTNSGTWISYEFKLTISSGTSGDAYFLIVGSTNESLEKGNCKIVFIAGTGLWKSLYKFLWKQNEDLSIEIYVASRGTKLGSSVFLKEPNNYTDINSSIKVVDSINEDGFQEIIVV